jgi:hypothetical protein
VFIIQGLGFEIQGTVNKIVETETACRCQSLGFRVQGNENETVGREKMQEHRDGELEFEFKFEKE